MIDYTKQGRRGTATTYVEHALGTIQRGKTTAYMELALRTHQKHRKHKTYAKSYNVQNK